MHKRGYWNQADEETAEEMGVGIRRIQNRMQKNTIPRQAKVVICGSEVWALTWTNRMIRDLDLKPKYLLVIGNNKKAKLDCMAERF